MVRKRIRRDSCNGSQQRRKKGVVQESENAERSSNVCIWQLLVTLASPRGTLETESGMQ